MRPNHWFRRGFFRREWNDIQRRYALDRIRHPRELTLRDWLTHAKLFVKNIAAIALTGAAVYWCLRPFSPHWAAFAMDMAVGGMLADWMYGKYRKERPPVRQIREPHGELQSDGASRPAPIKP